jgi:tetratricopeptide (TPR) repeat protein
MIQRRLTTFQLLNQATQPDKALSRILTSAFQSYQLGRLAEAESLYRKALNQQPEQAEALHWLGAILCQTDRLDEGLFYLQKAIVLIPNDANCQNSLGVALMQKNLLEQAAYHLRQAIVLNPNHFLAYKNLAELLYKQDDAENAIMHLQQAITLHPNDADAYNRLGTIFYEKNRLEEAAFYYKQAITLRPDEATTLINFGNLLRLQGNSAEALKYLQTAFNLNPNSVAIHNGLGLAYLAQNNVTMAILHLQQAITLDPSNADSYYNLGLAFQEQDQLMEAVSSYQTAIALAPNHTLAYTNLAIVLRELGNLDEAIDYHQKALALDANNGIAHHAFGNTLIEYGNMELAITHLRLAITLNPDDINVHCSLAHALLSTGNLRDGFAENEWRWQQPHMQGWMPFLFSQPQWDGSALNGRTILLQAEQGFGDTIQFIRYAPLVKACGGRVVVACQPHLKRLLETVGSIDRVVVPGEEEIPEFQVYALLMSLPHLLGTTLETIPHQIPYLSVPAATTHMLEIPPGTHLKVGLVWASGYRTEHKQLTKLYERKSCPPSLYARLLDIPAISFYSLQFGRDVADVMSFNERGKLHDLSSKIKDFADTAAFIEQLDLVISVDTAVAHLAGALGKPVWVLLSYTADWRWLLKRDDSPWYPTMQLFRQSSPEDWQGVVEQVITSLKQIISGTFEPVFPVNNS